jgi:sugar diacid utilization regulator
MTTSARGISLAELGLGSTVEMSTTQPQQHTSPTEATGTTSSAPVHKLYDILRGLLTIFSPAHPLDEMLRSLATLTRQATSQDLCVVMLLESLNGRMTMQTSSPDLYERGVFVVPPQIDQHLWKKLSHVSEPGQLPDLTVHEKEQLNPLKNVQYETLLIVPLIAHNDCFGLINCYSSKYLDISAEDQLLLSTIAMQASLAIQGRLFADAPARSSSIVQFFDDLLSEKTNIEESLRGRAASLGCDLTIPHAMVMLAAIQMLESNEPPTHENQLSAFNHTIKLTSYRLQDNYPGSLLYERENILYCILPLDKDMTGGGLKTWLDELVLQVERKQRVRIFAGISGICHDIVHYRRGFAEAEEALRIGQCLSQQARSLHFNDLGVYRYLYTFARENSQRDLYLDQVALISHYDQGHKRSELLDTLELYLEHGGNIKDTSELLGVHRNTLTQRIERIQSLCTINVEQPSNWLPLQVAIKVHKLRTSGV